MGWQSVRFERDIRSGGRGRVELQMPEARDQHGRQAIERWVRRYSEASAWDPWNSWHYALGNTYMGAAPFGSHGRQLISKP